MLAAVASDHRVLVFGPPRAPQSEWVQEVDLSQPLLAHLNVGGWSMLDLPPTAVAADWEVSQRTAAGARSKSAGCRISIGGAGSARAARSITTGKRVRSVETKGEGGAAEMEGDGTVAAGADAPEFAEAAAALTTLPEVQPERRVSRKKRRAAKVAKVAAETAAAEGQAAPLSEQGPPPQVAVEQQSASLKRHRRRSSKKQKSAAAASPPMEAAGGPLPAPTEDAADGEGPTKGAVGMRAKRAAQRHTAAAAVAEQPAMEDEATERAGRGTEEQPSAPPKRSGRSQRGAAAAAAAASSPAQERLEPAGGEATEDECENGGEQATSETSPSAIAAAAALASASAPTRAPKKPRNQHMKRKDEGMLPSYEVPEDFSADQLPGQRGLPCLAQGYRWVQCVRVARIACAGHSAGGRGAPPPARLLHCAQTTPAASHCAAVDLSDRRNVKWSVPNAFVRRFLLLREQVRGQCCWSCIRRPCCDVLGAVVSSCYRRLCPRPDASGAASILSRTKHSPQGVWQCSEALEPRRKSSTRKPAMLLHPLVLHCLAAAGHRC